MSDNSIYIHPQAIVDPMAKIGAGTVIWALAQIMGKVTIGLNCSISGGCFIESGVVLGNNITVKNGCLIWDGVHIEDDVFIGPAVTFTNDRTPRSPRMVQMKERYSTPENWRTSTIIGQGASLGARSVILSDLTIGAYAMIGAGSLVTRDVPSHALVYGSPARQYGWVCRCGQKLNPDFTCTKCGTTLELPKKCY